MSLSPVTVTRAMTGTGSYDFVQPFIQYCGQQLIRICFFDTIRRNCPVTASLGKVKEVTSFVGNKTQFRLDINIIQYDAKARVFTPDSSR